MSLKIATLIAIIGQSVQLFFYLDNFGLINIFRGSREGIVVTAFIPIICMLLFFITLFVKQKGGSK